MASPNFYGFPNSKNIHVFSKALIICRMRASFGVGITVPVVIDIIPLTWQTHRENHGRSPAVLLFFFGKKEMEWKIEVGFIEDKM